MNLLRCFVCGKMMRDGETLDSHVGGKAHRQSMLKLKETFQRFAHILRLNIQSVEEKKIHEQGLMARMSPSYRKEYAKLVNKHLGLRKVKAERLLTRFLHPKCFVCNIKEFSSRLQWVYHRMSPKHLRCYGEWLEKRNTRRDGADVVEEESVEINELQEEEALQMDENAILELTDELSDIDNRIPAYNPSRVISVGSVTPASGFRCDLCNKFFASEVLSQVRYFSVLYVACLHPMICEYHIGTVLIFC